MPSPFVGMDPFLEQAKVFPDLHDGLIFCLQGALHEVLPTRYFAAKGARVWIEATGRQVEPDVDVFRLSSPASQAGNGVAVLQETEARPVLIQVPEEEYHETFLDIFQANGEERLVTTIEILNLSNKTPGAKGQKLYRKKQRDMRRNHVNLLEIDLLRSGQHTTAIPETVARKQAGNFDYHVCVRLGNSPLDFHVYPIRLEDRLPKVAVPLGRGDPFATVDLQAVFDKAYENGAYPRRVRYSENVPVPPLRPDQADWATALLRDKGLLPPAEATP